MTLKDAIWWPKRGEAEIKYLDYKRTEVFVGISTVQGAIKRFSQEKGATTNKLTGSVVPLVADDRGSAVYLSTKRAQGDFRESVPVPLWMHLFWQTKAKIFCR